MEKKCKKQNGCLKRLFSSSSLSAIRVVSFHAKMGSIKDRDGMDLTEAENIKKRWQEYTAEMYKKIFMTQIITMV